MMGLINVAGGRPSKYDPAFCETVIDSGAEGKTLAGMAEDLDIDRTTLNAWREAHPEFSIAVKRGLQKSQAWWENQGRIATFGGHAGFNATSFIFNMKNRFPDDWRDRQEIDHSNSDGTMKPTIVEFVTPKARDEGDD